MSQPEIRFPGESEAYRAHRARLLEAEAALRVQVEAVAELRRSLPPGGPVQDYVFQGADGPVRLSDLFGAHRTLILYGFMYGADDTQPCPMCSAFLDAMSGQLAHLTQRVSFAVVARASQSRLADVAGQRGWRGLTLLSAADNDYPREYHTEMPDGSQLPMCNVFVQSDQGPRHFWGSELFFVPWQNHPRHVDMVWPLWNWLDLTPEGRGDFMPRREY